MDNAAFMYIVNGTIQFGYCKRQKDDNVSVCQFQFGPNWNWDLLSSISLVEAIRKYLIEKGMLIS